MIEERGMSLEQAEARIRHQSSEEERRAIADIVIDSTHPIPEMLAQVDEIYVGWLTQNERYQRTCEANAQYRSIAH